MDLSLMNEMNLLYGPVFQAEGQTLLKGERGEKAQYSIHTPMNMSISFKNNII